MDLGLITGSSLCLLESFGFSASPPSSCCSCSVCCGLGGKAGGTGSDLRLRLFPRSHLREGLGSDLFSYFGVMGLNRVLELRLHLREPELLHAFPRTGMRALGGADGLHAAKNKVKSVVVATVVQLC